MSKPNYNQQKTTSHCRTLTTTVRYYNYMLAFCFERWPLYFFKFYWI